MPSFAVHAVVPLLLLLAFRRLDRRAVFALWPLTIAPDFDYFFGFHRATLGNVFILVPFAAALAYAWWPDRRRPAVATWMLVAIAYLGSHLLMDLFTGGSVLFYPFSDYTFCYDARILVVTATNQVQPTFAPCGRGGIPTVAPLYPWLSAVDAAIFALVLPVGLAAGASAWWRARGRAWWRARGGRRRG